jgi:branched-chain amino acid transport system ATP-binding protein
MKMSEMLTIASLEVSYGAIRAIKQVSMKVEKGSITAILGANGGGKSTLLKTISGIVPVAKGAILYNGEDITRMEPEDITKAGIVHVPEGRQIFGDLSVYENLLIGAFTLKSGPVRKEIVTLPKYQNQKTKEVILTRKEMIENNLRRVFSYFPVLEERQNQQAVSLSGGEQQMLAIARALMGNPKLLILDEPSLGLAPLIVRDIFRIIKELNEAIGLTVLIVEQNALQTLRIADYAYLLQVGKIVKEGDASTLQNDASLIEAYLGH